jgi:ABC-type transport system substrate-binding protein
VEFTIKTILDPQNDSIYKFNLSNISSCTAIDDRTVNIILKKPNSFTPELMTFPIMPRRFFPASRKKMPLKQSFRLVLALIASVPIKKKNKLYLKQAEHGGIRNIVMGIFLISRK